MIKRLFFIVVLLLPCLAYGADLSADLSVNVTPTPPAAAAAAGFTTLALDSEFSQPQPSGWFACSGGVAGAQWYQGVTGGDTVAAPCSVTGGQPGGNFNLITDPLSGKQVLDLTMHLSDVILGSRAYASIQTADDAEMHQHGTPCCVLGELFPYGFYMEARYRVLTTPDADHGATAGVWTAFWQAGQGLSPYTGHETVEIDHPEQHGELRYNYSPGQKVGPLLDWGVINWYDSSGAPCFGSPPPGYGGTQCAGFLQNEDPRQYHTFGVRVTTDGSSGIAYCSYADGVQGYCASGAFNNSAQYAEKKYPIIFAGIACYPQSEGVISCLNIPITSWYSCVSPAPAGAICLSASGAVIDNSSGNWISSISGVTGCPSCNGSWVLLPFTNSTSGTDYYIYSNANDPTYTRPSWPGGTPTGGTINALSQVDMYIDHVSVWTCSTWQSGPCNTPLDTGLP
jgi:hypothetical protein